MSDEPAHAPYQHRQGFVVSPLRAMKCWWTNGYWPNGDTTTEAVGEFLYGLRPIERRRRKLRGHDGGMVDDPNVAPPAVDDQSPDPATGYGDYAAGLPVKPLPPGSAP